MTQPATEFSAIYRRYGADVFRLALSLCANRDDAEDITAETFARVWTSPAPVAGDTVKAYLFTIARNVYLQRRRRDARQVALDDSQQDSRDGPAELAEQHSEMAEVNVRLTRLSEIDRAVVIMRMDGAPYEEIAAALGLTVAAARVKVHRARLALAGIR